MPGVGRKASPVMTDRCVKVAYDGPVFVLIFRLHLRHVALHSPSFGEPPPVQTADCMLNLPSCNLCVFLSCYVVATYFVATMKLQNRQNRLQDLSRRLPRTIPGYTVCGSFNNRRNYRGNSSTFFRLTPHLVSCICCQRRYVCEKHAR